MANQNLPVTHKVNTELIYRAVKLGGKGGIVTGPIIHLPHKDNRFEKGCSPEEASKLLVKNYKEKFKISKMTAKELEEYIKTWGWVK